MKSEKGFTLIELLVVVAIIGILATVVLSSLGNARTRAQIAKVKGQMAQMPAAAEMFADTNNSSYGQNSSSCTTTTSGELFADETSGMKRLVAVASYPAGTALNCQSTASGWGVQVTYSGTQYCVDSVTNSVKTGSTLSGTVCQ